MSLRAQQDPCVRLPGPLLALLALGGLGSGCLHDGEDRPAVGFVAGPAADAADWVVLAWRFTADGQEPLARFHGAAPLDAGTFDVDALLASAADYEPPTLDCYDGAGAVGVAPYAVAEIVAVTGEPSTDDLDLQALATAVSAVALDVAVVWANEDVPRASWSGQRLESALSAGLQLAALRPCRIPADCQGVEDAFEVVGEGPDPDLCLDPWPEDGMVLLQTAPRGR